MKFETIKQKLLGDERAVSPVIGVILMVAITVILAAVIGTFVLGLGENVSQTSPQASISFSDHSDTWTSGADANAFVVAHDGGADLTANNLKIVIRNADDNSAVATWEAGTGFDIALTLHLNGGAGGVAGTNTVGTGDTLVINDDGAATTDLATGKYKVQIIHTPSESTIASGTVTLK